MSQPKFRDRLASDMTLFLSHHYWIYKVRFLYVPIEFLIDCLETPKETRTIKKTEINGLDKRDKK